MTQEDVGAPSPPLIGNSYHTPVFFTLNVREKYQNSG
jgi:hypothetical protein